MIKVMTFVRRRPGLSRAEFLDGWLNHHAPLVMRTHDFARHVRGYRQNHTVASMAIFGAEPMPDVFDGCAELWFETIETFAQAMQEPDYRAVIQPDERRWFDDLSTAPVIVAEEHEIKAPRASG